jgi:DNA-binding MarR family transcriptional regulator
MVDQTGEPDFAIVVTGVARVVADRLGAAVERAGIQDMRASFGYVIRALAERERTLTELADLLSVTKQAAIKVVDEMEERDFIERVPDASDRRAKVIRLTPKARRVRRAALAESRKIERELTAELGASDVRAMRRTLLHLLERSGTLADAAAGRSRAVW